MIKAIFFDVDGTLVSFDTHTIPPSTLKAIELVQKKGIKVFISTGRHKKALNNLGNLQFDGYVTINGGYCTVENDKVIHQHFVEKSDIEAILEYQKSNPFPCMVVSENGFFINYMNETSNKVLEMLEFPNVPIGDIETARELNVLQFVSFFSENQEDEIMAKMPNCDSTRWHHLFTDIVPKGSNKAIGIEKILQHYGLKKEECMVFGDGGNDTEMLRYVGLGVAMGNARDEVKAVANHVTTSVDDNGIWNALKKFEII